jgi:chromosomal replication initiation ATPase DnaA
VAYSALYSVESFSSKGEMEKKIEGVRKATSIDIEYYEKQVQAADAFKAKMRTIDPLFLEEFQGSHKRAETAQEEMLSVLEEWADATVDLYDSAMQKEGTFKVVEGNLVFTDGTSSAIFNDKLNRSQELLQLFKEKRELLVQEQNKFLEDLGVSKAAIGLKAK